MTTKKHLKLCWDIDIINGAPRSYTAKNYVPCPIFTVAITDSRSRITVRTGVIGEDNQPDLCAKTLIDTIRKSAPTPDFLICHQHCDFIAYINCCANRFGITLLFRSPFQPYSRTPIEKILRSRNFNRRQFSCIEQFNKTLLAAVEAHNRKINAHIQQAPQQ